ncbi:MAG: hypothetical protein QF577_02225 [Phycisphaerae bacterium]|nr:hypothetical protein [Phycisphaerae bacterium]
MTSKPKIVIVGGGSNSWTPNIVRDMLLTDSLSNAEYVLFDINKQASDLTKAFLDKLAGRLGLTPRIVSTDNRTRALKDADYIIITISTGGLKAMAHDLAIPDEYGIYHPVGDTCGPGGWARFIRNFDVFVSLARDMNRCAPGAIVLNYSNPMTTLTDVLARLFKGPVVGLCHGLFGNLDFIKRLYNLKSEDEIAAKYAGLNHFFWITEARAGGIDVIADLTRRLRRQELGGLLKGKYADAMGWTSGRKLATELFRQTGVMPYVGDRHTSEFFSCYITSRKNMKKYGIERTNMSQRRKAYTDRTKRLQKMIKGRIDQEYFDRSRETAADIIAAHWQGKVFIDVGNVPNVGQISSLPHGVVVETAVRVDRNGFTPLTFGPLPEPVQSMVAPWAAVFTMWVDACFKKDKELALQALRLDPICSHMTGRQVNEMGRRLLTVHKRYITVF